MVYGIWDMVWYAIWYLLWHPIWYMAWHGTWLRFLFSLRRAKCLQIGQQNVVKTIEFNLESGEKEESGELDTPVINACFFGVVSR